MTSNDSTTRVIDAANMMLLQCMVEAVKMHGNNKLVQDVCEAACISYTSVREAAEMGDSGEENFDGWLPLRLASSTKYYDYTLTELEAIRNVVRVAADVNEIAKNVLLHRRNFIVGRGIKIDIYPDDLGNDPVKLAEGKEDAQIKKMRTNWKLFCNANNFTQRLWEWVRRCDTDGEVVLRIFKGDTAPAVRFVEPEYVKSDESTIPYGVEYDESDAERVKSVRYMPPDANEETTIKGEDIIVDKRNVSMTAPRGISTFWPVLSNLRRLEKILVNSSVLATVQAAITMVRKHDTATGVKVQNMVRKGSDGVDRTDSTGKTIYSRKVRPGTVLDAPKGISYEFPSHTVDASSFIKIAEHELSHVASAFVLPVEWLLTAEPKDPLTPGSPVIANFEVEQQLLFTKVEELFWNIQGRMGVNVAKNKAKYTLYFNGKRLAVGKALDEARVDQILTTIGATSPQETAAKHGHNWVVSRANTIRHRATKQDGEAMPGDAGNTNPSNTASNGGNGDTKNTVAGPTSRTSAGDGGSNK